MTRHLTSPGSTLGNGLLTCRRNRCGQRNSTRARICFRLERCLYEMSTGALPFRGESSGVIFKAILDSVPVSPVRFNPDLPAKLEEIISKALEKDRAMRYQHASEMGADLRRLKRDTESGRSVSSFSGSDAAVQETSSARVSSPSQVSTQAPARNKLWIGIAAVLLIGIAVVAYTLRQKSDRASVQSLAVLPFTSDAIGSPGAVANDYLTDGITEGVINDLSQIPQLRVMARSTVFRFKGKDSDPQQIGTNLKVDAVVTGHITQQDDNLNIQAELVNVSDGSQMWGQHFSRKMADVSSLQGDIAREITAKLHLQSGGEKAPQIAGPGTQNQEAYEAYLKGRSHLIQRTESSIRQAIADFRQAVALDPNYAQAWTSLSFAYSVARSYLPPDESKILPTGENEAEKALKLDPSLGEAHLAIAVLTANRFERDAAEREFHLAIESNPNDANAHYLYAFLDLLPQQRDDQAFAEFRKALALDPLSGIINTNYGLAFFLTKRFDEARQQFKKTLELDPNFVQGLCRSAEFEAYMGNLAVARQHLLGCDPGAQKMEIGTDDSQASKELFWKAYIRIYEGHPGQTAFANSVLGNKEEAFRDLNLAVVQTPAGLAVYMRLPMFAPLVSDPRYADLLRRMKLK